MPFVYKHAKENKRRSIIKYNGKTFQPLTSRPKAGWSAYTRFFGAENERIFVVKQPKPDSRTGKAPLDTSFISSYKKESEIWNFTYPDQPAKLVIDGGLRLVLPCLPGKPISEALVSDYDYPLIYCQQVLAIVLEVKRFHDLGWEHNDLRINNDNMLLEKLGDNFKAHIIDFERASNNKENRTNTDWAFIESLKYPIRNFRCRDDLTSFDKLIPALHDEINRLKLEAANSVPKNLSI
jgi:hypothetical protein